MNNIIFIVGLPGSGKSYFGESLAKEMPDSVFLDDLGRNGDPLGKLFERLRPTSPKWTKNIIVADLWLCKKENRERTERNLRNTFDTLKGEKLNISWVFFENAPDKCRENVKFRKFHGDDREVEPSIWIYSKQYDIPEGADVREIWQPSL